MALGFLVCAAPDSHISYLQQHQGLVHSYLDGTTPTDSNISFSLPEWWPKQPPEILDSWGINHRNTDLYHWILNGGPDLVTGGGSIFQTWYEPGHSASVVNLDKYNERFAFHSEQISELASLVAGVNVKSVLKAFVEWCKSQGKRYEDLDESACESFVAEFRAFENLLNDAIRKGYGLIW
jgi:hypothetical protein